MRVVFPLSLGPTRQTVGMAVGSVGRPKDNRRGVYGVEYSGEVTVGEIVDDLVDAVGVDSPKPTVLPGVDLLGDSVDMSTVLTG